MKAVYKNTLKLFLLAAIVSLSACGKKKKSGGGGPGPGPAPAVGVPTPTPNNTLWSNVSGGDYYSQYFQAYQAAYGSIVVVNNVNAGFRTIPAGTYTWPQFYASVIAYGAQSCVNNYYSPNSNYNCGSPNGQWGSFNYGFFNQVYAGYWNSSAVYVTGGTATGGGSMSVTLAAVMNVFYGSISNMYTSGYYGYYNSGYYYPNYYQGYCGYGNCNGGYYGSYNQQGSGWSASIGIGGQWR